MFKLSLILFGDKIKVLNKPSLFQNFAASALSALSLFGSKGKKCHIFTATTLRHAVFTSRL